MLSTVHHGNDYAMVIRNTKVDGVHQQLQIRQLRFVKEHNKKMRGVDTFDQQVVAYWVFRKTTKCFKAIFLDFIHIATVSGFKLFEQFHLQNPQAIKTVLKVTAFSGPHQPDSTDCRHGCCRTSIVVVM